MLKELRLNKKLTQEELANLLNTSEANVSRYENYKTTPPITMFNRICEVLKLSNKQKAELLMSFDKRKGD